MVYYHFVGMSVEPLTDEQYMALHRKMSAYIKKQGLKPSGSFRTTVAPPSPRFDRRLLTEALIKRKNLFEVE